MTTTIKQSKIKWQCDERLVLDQWEAIEWARRTLSLPDIVYLDSETTGLHGAYLVEIAVLSRHGSAMLNTKVRPPVPSDPGAERVHGITKEMLEDAPTFPEIYPRLQEVLSDRTVIIYNAAFDCGILQRCCDYYQLPPLKFMPQCAMEWYAQYKGEWSGYWGNYRWQKLPGAGHRAAADAWACYQLVRRMAIAPSCPVDISVMFPPVQLFCEWKEIARICYEWKPINGDYHYDYHRRRRRCFAIKLPHFCLKRAATLVAPDCALDDDDDIPW